MYNPSLNFRIILKQIKEFFNERKILNSEIKKIPVPEAKLKILSR